MTVDQIKMLRNFHSKDDGTGNRLAGSIACIFNNEVAYIDSRDYVIYDDANELVHAVRPNTEGPIEQARFPYRITTGFYDNVQYMEALYNMSNFGKAIDGLFVETGLISEAQKEHIMKWAVGIQNHTIIPKQPGPYFKDTMLPIGRPPIPEIRPDGIHHASPNDFITYRNKIESIVTPAIEASAMAPVKRVRNIYDVEVESLEGIAEQIKGIIEAFPVDDLFMASFSCFNMFATYKPSTPKTIETFIANANKILNRIRVGHTAKLQLSIEAYNTRVDYTIYLRLEQAEVETPEDFNNYITSAVSQFIRAADFENGEVSLSGKTINATIDSTDIGDDVDMVIEWLNGLAVESVTFNAGSTSVTLNIGDADSIENFKKGVLNSMPTENGSTVNGTVEATSNAGNSIVYTLKVKYLNVDEAVAKIGSNYYSVLANAFAAAVSGDTIELLKDIEVSNADVSGSPNSAVLVVPDGVTFNGGSHTITAAADWTVNSSASYGTNHIMGISGTTGTINNVTIVGHANMKSGIVVYGQGNAAIDNVTVQNCGNCGVQVGGATVVLSNWNSSGNTWGSVNADKDSDGNLPAVTFVSGTMAEPVEIYTEITDQDVITAATLTKYQGFGTNLKGFIYYTSDVSKLGTVYNGAVYETINDMIDNNDVVDLSVTADVTESVTVPAGKTLNLNLGDGVIIANAADEDTITNNGTMTINGTGTINNTVHGMAAVTNNGTLTILGGTFDRTAEAGDLSGNGGNSYYTIVNHGDMTIGSPDGDNSGILIKNAGGFSSMVTNGWYDSTGKNAEDDTCTLTIYGGTFQGGKYCLKNDELGVINLYGGDFSDADDCTILNWGDLTINDGTFTATGNLANLANGTYGLGVGKAAIKGGTFNTESGNNVIMISGYPSTDITITGGTFSTSSDLVDYIPEGYEIDSETVPGKYVVVQISTADAVEEQIDSFIDGLNGEGVSVEADPDVSNTYTIITDGSLNAGTMIDQIVSIEDVGGITISDGETSASYTAGGDLATFKSQVNAMLPTLNEDAEVVLTMTVDVAE